MTPHNEASPGDYAKTVLVAGDPLRAQWIAETFLEKPRCVNRVRGALGFTGLYKGVPVSLQATGMGRPSFTIYVHELVSFYGVRTVIRTGSCGALTAEVSLRDVFAAESAIMDVDFDAGGIAAGKPDAELVRLGLAAAEAASIRCHFGPMICSDTFYHPKPDTRFDAPRAAGIIAVDMETSNLFTLAEKLGFRALSLCTVVDSLLTGEESTLSERPEIFGTLARVGLDAAIAET